MKNASGVGLVVVTVGITLGVGCVLAIIVGLDGARDRAYRVDCTGNLRNLGLALHQYAGDNDEAVPKTLQEIESYAASQPQLLVCPGSDPKLISAAADFSRIGPTNVSYYYVAGGSLSSRLPSDVQMFSHPDTHRGDGANVLFTGGHVEWLPVENREGETFWGELARCGITPEMVAAATNKIIHVEDLKLD